MNLSMKWLADYVDCSLPVKQFCYDMTMSGSKVEGFEAEGDEISNVVVGKILSVEPHGNSDHLVVCMVDVGKDAPVQIVTGAPNVSAGDYVPAALDGSTLPGGVKIKKGKLRGVESNGMLCSLGELKLTKHDFPYAIEDGIFLLGEDCDRTPGADIRAAIGLNDTTVEFEITSNRPDCLSVLGLAREAAATFNVPSNVKAPAFQGVDGAVSDLLSVEIKNTALCSRYIGGVVKNVKIAPSPRWLRERLRASGVRPINNFVDITNFVMLEYGHPMHAFDLRYVEGNSIIVRNAQAGETITTLDGTQRALSPEMLVIADAKKPVAVAGVMGGEYSGIMDDTATVVFEAACFDGASVRTTAKKLGMRTDASARFEKGLDADNCLPAIKRAFELVELLGAGEVVRELIDADYSDKTPKTVEFDPAWINTFLGTSIPVADMADYLTRLGFTVENGVVTAPRVRIDIACKADVAEEVARIYGYNNIPATIIKGVANAKLTPAQKFERKLRATMSALGYSEITTYSFISPKYFDKINLPADSALRKTVTITNPLGEDTSVMRTSVLPSMCEVLGRNFNNRNKEAFLFEIGTEYLPDADETKLPAELARLCLGSYGGESDFFALKGTIEELLDRIGLTGYETARADESTPFGERCAFHPGRVAVMEKNGIPFAMLGELHPSVCENYGIDTKCYAAKLLVPELLALAEPDRVYVPLPKFPAITRDISVVCDDTLPAAALEKAIRGAVGKILEKVELFDVYKGKQIEDGKKSVSYAISMRSHDGTLTDDQAEAAMKKVLKALSALGAELRG
ncbi:MAG: phenylalanine--tRNA ligase subunit beta [Oscillospiraceae bacterium]